MKTSKSFRAVVVCLLSATVGVSSALATWSIILTDYRTKEIAVGSATCVTFINLVRETPVVRVGLGAATAQSFVDVSGQNRLVIWNELANRTDPWQILRILRAQDNAHRTRQYGIVDTIGRAATFSGRANGDFKGGVVGQVGTIAYAIQGNVITGQPLIDAVEQTVINTPGGLPEKLMAAMETARAFGGDGRCSCDQNAPDSCGSPPDGFDPNTVKTAHVGFILDARRGDVDGVCNNNDGCASGSYYLLKNVKNKGANAPEPVRTLRTRFNNWRNSLIGVPDQVESILQLSRTRVPNDGTSTINAHIEILDWQGMPATGVENVEIMHDPDGSDGSSTIAPLTVVDADLQIYEAEITAGRIVGLDRIAVRVTYNGGQQRFLMPSGLLAIQDLTFDLNSDGVVDGSDLSLLLTAFGVSDAGDLDGDGDTDIADLGLMLAVPGLDFPPNL